MVAILTHDGLYEDGNKAYLMNWADEKSLQTNLPLIVHHADHMASRIEYERWKSTKGSIKEKPNKQYKYNKPKLSSANTNAQEMFKDLFKK